MSTLQGGKFGGWALYMNNGKPAYTYNYFGLKRYTIASSEKITNPNAKITLEFTYDGGEKVKEAQLYYLLMVKKLLKDE